MKRSRPRPRCPATLHIDKAAFRCDKNAGHRGPHEESGSVDSDYRTYLIRWRGDSRETCDTCAGRTEHVVKCQNCDSMICLNCRDPKQAEQLRTVCIECPPEEPEEDE